MCVERLLFASIVKSLIGIRICGYVCVPCALRVVFPFTLSSPATVDENGKLKLTSNASYPHTKAEPLIGGSAPSKLWATSDSLRAQKVTPEDDDEDFLPASVPTSPLFKDTQVSPQWNTHQPVKSNTWKKVKFLGQQAGMGFFMGLFVGGTVGLLHVATSGRGFKGVCSPGSSIAYLSLLLTSCPVCFDVFALCACVRCGESCIAGGYSIWDYFCCG